MVSSANKQSGYIGKKSHKVALSAEVMKEINEEAVEHDEMDGFGDENVNEKAPVEIM